MHFEFIADAVAHGLMKVTYRSTAVCTAEQLG